MFTKGERPLLANMVLSFVNGLIVIKYVCLVDFLSLFLYIHNGTSSPKGSLACTALWAIMSKRAITSRLFSSFFCPRQKWAIRFVFVNYLACLVWPVCVVKLRLTATAAITHTQRWIKSDLFFSGSYTSFSKTQTQKQTKPSPKQLFFVPSLICQLYCLGRGGGGRKNRKDYKRQRSRHKELMGCQYPWQQH